MSDFFETEAGQFIANAHRYIRSARVLLYSDEAELDYETLKVPALHLLAHGLELLLKYPHLRAGAPQRDVASRFGHNLSALWQASEAQELRATAYLAGEAAWKQAQSSGDYPQDDFEADPRANLDGAVEALGHLHDKSSSFALRYTVSGPMRAPRPRYLVDAFGEVAYCTLCNPAYLE